MAKLRLMIGIGYLAMASLVVAALVALLARAYLVAGGILLLQLVADTAFVLWIARTLSRSPQTSPPINATAHPAPQQPPGGAPLALAVNSVMESIPYPAAIIRTDLAPFPPDATGAVTPSTKLPDTAGFRVELFNTAWKALGFGGPDGLNAAAWVWLRPLLYGVQRPSSTPTPPAPVVQAFQHGRELFLQPQATPIRDQAGRTAAFAVVLADVTGVKAAEETRAGVLSAISHQLKTPMTSIQMAVHLLSEDAIGRLSPRQAELLKTACEDADRLQADIEELLAAARRKAVAGEPPP